MSLTPAFSGGYWVYGEDNEEPSLGFYSVAKVWLLKITFVNSTTMAVSMRWGKDGYTGPTYQAGSGYTIYINGSDVTGFVPLGGDEYPVQNVTVPSSGTFTIRVLQTCNVRSGVVNASQTIDNTFTVVDVTSSLVFVTGNSRIFRLPPPATWAGRMPVFVKTLSGSRSFVHSNAGEPIDALSDGYVDQSFTYLNDVCIGFVSDSTQWYIASYFRGTVPTSSTTGGTAIASPCVFVDFVNANKTVSLPNPATWGRGQLLAICVRQAPTPGSYTCSVVSNGYWGDNIQNAFTITLSPTSLTGGVLLSTNGTKWYIVAMSNGSDLSYSSVGGSEGRPQMTSGICLVQSGSNDGVTPPDVSSVASSSVRLGIVKMRKAAPAANGIVLQGANWGAGQTASNKIVKSGGTFDYSGMICLFGKAPNSGASYVMHPIATYPSVY